MSDHAPTAPIATADLDDEQLLALFSAAGLTLVPERRAEVLKLARWMKQQARLIAGPYPVELEPAATFRAAGRP